VHFQHPKQWEFTITTVTIVTPAQFCDGCDGGDVLLSCLTLAKRGYTHAQDHHTLTLNTAENTRTFINAYVTVNPPDICV
jgi:hypothetical protein